MLPVVIKILLAVHVLVSLLIVLIVLMQRPKNEGLGAAFGGGMTDNLFGAQTTNVLQTITRWLGGIFFGLTLLLSILYVKQSTQKSDVQKKLNAAPAVVPSTAAANLPTAASAPVQVTDTPETPGAAAPTDAKAPAEMKPVPAPDAAVPAEAPKPAAPAPATPPSEAAKTPQTPAAAPAPVPADASKPAEPAAPAKPADRPQN